jgi:CRP-like cAMP-binding protein
MTHYPLAQIKKYFFDLVPELDDEKWKRFESVATVRQVPKGTVLLKPGMKSNFVSYVNYGLIRSYHLLDGKELITFFAHEDCYFSEYETFLAQMPALKYSEALEDCELVDLHYDNLQFLYQSLPECERAGRRVAEGLFVELCNRTNSFLLLTPEERYLEFLQRFPSLPQRLPQYMIASYLGITPEALSRIRARLSRKPLERFIDSDQ